jgi:hypothetical protein
VFSLVIPIVVGVAVAFAWLTIWAVTLRAFGITVLTRTPEERAAFKERVQQMGKVRYVLLFGVLGNGIGLGLGIAVAVMLSRGSADWRLGASLFGAMSLLMGSMNGLRRWNQLFRAEVPFPPVYLQPK